MLLMMAGSALAAGLPRSTAPVDARAYIISPLDGATVSSPVTVQFGLRGMGIAPAGIAMANTGHHHLLIDIDLPPLDQPVPADEHHLHFGKGQTEAVVTLAPGKHRLQLLLADHLHLPHEPPVASEPITITVR
jgi:hypothetical protein